MTRKEALRWLRVAMLALYETLSPDEAAEETIARAWAGILMPALVRGPAALADKAATLAGAMRAAEVGTPRSRETWRAVRRLCLFARALARAGWSS